MSKTIDLVRENRGEYDAGAEPALVWTSPGRYLTVDGIGAPGGAAFQEALSALYSVAWTMRMSKRASLRWKIPPLEALWWAGRSKRAFAKTPRGKWHWKLLLRVPEFIGPHDVFDAAMRVDAKKHPSPALHRVAVETLDEGECAQLLHVGPWSRERRSLAKLAAFEKSCGLRVRGPHHEIYWNDPRRTKPERLHTTLRQPVHP